MKDYLVEHIESLSYAIVDVAEWFQDNIDSIEQFEDAVGIAASAQLRSALAVLREARQDILDEQWVKGGGLK